MYYTIGDVLQPIRKNRHSPKLAWKGRLIVSFDNKVVSSQHLALDLSLHWRVWGGGGGRGLISSQSRLSNRCCFYCLGIPVTGLPFLETYKLKGPQPVPKLSDPS